MCKLEALEGYRTVSIVLQQCVRIQFFSPKTSYKHSLLIATINIYHIKAPVTTHEEDLDLKLSECVLLKLFPFSLR